jgi:hypothetical protein
MWLMTTKGFISAVAHRDNPELIMIRARERTTLVQLLPGKEIIETPSADYRYRCTLPKLEWILLVSDLAQGVDYPNFKTAAAKVKSNSPAYLDFLHKVWSLGERLLQKAGPD